MRILMIEDDTDAAAYLVNGLEALGHTVRLAHDGSHGLAMALDQVHDVLVVDRMLPGMDGLAVIRGLRAAGDHTPALILSALDEAGSRDQGLQAGGNDYLVKPFVLAEVLARLEALVRSTTTAGAQGRVLRVGDLKMDLHSRQVERGGQTIKLLPGEFRLLEYLMRNSGQVVTRSMLLEHAWDYNFEPQTNVIDMHVRRLRSKINQPPGPPVLYTIKSTGQIVLAEP